MAIRYNSKTRKKILLFQGLGRSSHVGSFIILRIDGLVITLPFAVRVLSENTMINPSLYSVTMADETYRYFLHYLYPKTFNAFDKDMQKDYEQMCDTITKFK